MIQGERPDWRPLQRVLPESLVPTFMWMCEVELASGERLHAYKHIDTRRYLHLGTGRGAFLDVGAAGYRWLPLATALELCLHPWWERLGASLEETTAAWAAIAAARRDG